MSEFSIFSEPQLSEKEQYDLDLKELKKEVENKSKDKRERKVMMNIALSQDEIRKNQRIIRMRKKLQNKIVV